LLHALNARFKLSELVQTSGVYVQNMAVAAFTFLSPDMATGPLGPIALENRRNLVGQSTEGQVLAFLRQLRRDADLYSEEVELSFIAIETLRVATGREGQGE
jgi:hypothetical protein